MNNPRVSVLMPVYNGEKYLRAAIDSILDQDYRDIELIILDDGSSDSSAAVALTYSDKRIRLISNSKNLGIAETLNRGIELCRGEYIVRMDADDISHPSRIATQVDFMDAHPDIGISGTNVQTFGTADATKWMYPSDPDAVRAELLFSPSLAHPTVILRRNILLDNKLRYSSAYPHAEDYEFWLRCSRHTRLSNLGRILLSYRLHPAKVGEKHKLSQMDSMARARDIVLSELHIKPSDEERLLHNSLGNWDFENSRQYLVDTEQWLLRLQKANLTTGMFPDDIFAYVLFEKWFSVCYRARSCGTGRWMTFLRSPLSRIHRFKSTSVRHFVVKHLILLLDMQREKFSS